MSILPKKEEKERLIEVDAVPAQPSYESTRVSTLSINRLSYIFNRIIKDKTNTNLDNIKDTIKKNIYIVTKKNKDKIDETEYFLKSMSLLGKNTFTIFQSLYKKDKVKENPKIKKGKSNNNKKFSLGSAIATSIAMSALILPIVSSKLKAVYDNISNNIPEEDIDTRINVDDEPTDKARKEEEMFGLTTADKLAVKRLQDKTGDEYNIFDKIAKYTTNGAVTSLSALIFGQYDFKHTQIYKMFSINISKYSDEIVKVFQKVIKNIFTWFKDNIVDPINNNVSSNYEKLKNSAIEKLNKLFSLEPSNSKVIEQQAVPGAGITLVSSLKSLVLTFVGKGDLTKTYKDNLKDIIGAKEKDKKYKWSLFGKSSDESLAGAESGETGSNFNFEGAKVNIDGAIVNKGYVNKTAVFKAFTQAGFGAGQSAALTAEVGRENDYRASVLFGNHKDPARGQNIGFISWQGNRKIELVKRLASAGVLKSKNPVLMDQTYASLMVMANYVMYEMKTTYKNQAKTKAFLANRNITFAQAAPLLGGADSYIAWARGQNTIKLKDGSRKSWDWKAQEAKASKYHKQLAKELGGKGDEGDTSIEVNDNIKASYEPDELARGDNDIPQEINTNIKKNKIRSSYTSNIDNVYNAQPTIKSNRILSTPQHTTSKVMGNIDDANTSSSGTSSSKPIQSIFEMLLEKDLTGNMLT